MAINQVRKEKDVDPETPPWYLPINFCVLRVAVSFDGDV